LLGKMLPVSNHELIDVGHAAVIQEPPSHRSLTTDPSPVRGEGDNVAGLGQEDPIFGNPGFLGNQRVMIELAVFSMDRDKKPGPGQVQHELQLFLARMSGDMNRPPALVVDFCAAPAKMVYQM